MEAESMTLKENQVITGERAEYFAKNILYNDIIFRDGESPMKHGKNLKITNSEFHYKYPLWNTDNTEIKDSHFYELAKSGMWYAKNMLMENIEIEAPKEFRRCNGITLKNVNFTNAAETFWRCEKIRLENVKAKGIYFAFNSSDFYADNLELDGDYILDGGKNIEIHNSKIISKDAFWNSENVTVYDSYIKGEYLGWHSKNLKFVNCTIDSPQALCFVDNLKMENCNLITSVLVFEYSTDIDVDIKGRIESVKNPGNGIIKADEIGFVVLNPNRCDPNAIKIDCQKLGQIFSVDSNPNENI